MKMQEVKIIGGKRTDKKWIDELGLRALVEGWVDGKWKRRRNGITRGQDRM